MLHHMQHFVAEAVGILPKEVAQPTATTDFRSETLE